MANLSLQGLNKIYDNNVQAVFDFNLEIEDGEFVVLVGPSGCGKSTTLRMIAGLEEITSGKLFIDGKNVTNTASKDRDIAMVFQNYALYSHMTVYHNMAFSLVLRNENANVIHEKVMEAARILELTDQLNKRPKELSGGQKQRVAVGRAIVRNPKVFLFDEPLSNLDAKLRGSMRRELKMLHHRFKTSMIYVTHDQTEALTLADRIVVMDAGRVQQIGTPIELYESPANIFVASFIGLPPMNFFDATVKNGKVICEGFEYAIPAKHKEKLKPYEGKEIVFGVRPEDVMPGKSIDFTVVNNENLGQNTLVHGTIAGKRVIFKFAGWCEYKQQDEIKIDFKDEKVHYFDKETTKAI